MTDVLPTLAREWASLGASNAPKTVVPRDSPRIAAALNTFASYVNAEKQAQASGRRINVFLGRSQLMQCLSFDDVPGSAGRLHTATVSSIALGTERADSDTILLAASFAGVIAIWRLDALNIGKFQQVPTYARWRLDGTLPLPGEYVTALGVHWGRLAIGTDKAVSVWQRSTRPGSQWRRTWRKSAPRTILCVRWSPDGMYLAAVPLYDKRVLVWHTLEQDMSTLALVAKLSHTRVVHALDWRQARAEAEPRAVLVVTTANSAACIYAPVVDEPFVLRQWAAVDATVDLGTETTSDVVALMYCDAYRLATALQHDMDQLAYVEQHANIHGHQVESQQLRLAQLQQLMAHAPDLFFALLADGSIAVYALMNLESSSPALLNTYIMLRLPAGVAVESSPAPLLLQFVPLAYAGVPEGGGVVPTAIIHAQSANGMRGTAAVSLALLFDGDQRGIFVQDTLVANERDVARMPSTSAPMRFLRAEHKTDIVALDVTHSHRGILSLSQDGVLIGWHLAENGHGSLLSEHRVRLRGASKACVLGTDAQVAALVHGRLTLVVTDPAQAAGGSSALVTADIAVEAHDLPSGLAESEALVLDSACMGDAFLLAVCSTSGTVATWKVAAHGKAYHISSPALVSLDSIEPLGRVRVATMVESMVLADGTFHSLCTVDEHGTLDVWAYKDKWHSRERTKTAWPDVRMMCGSHAGHLALIAWTRKGWHVSIWDMSLAPFCHPCVQAMHIGGDVSHVPAAAWSTEHKPMLAVGSQAVVRVWAQKTEQSLLGPVPPVWGAIAEVDIGAIGSGTVSQVQWLAGSRLLIASSCQLFLYAAGGDKEAPASLPALCAASAALLPLYHPRNVQYALQMRMLDGVYAIFAELRRAMSSSLYDAKQAAEIHVPWEVLTRRTKTEERTERDTELLAALVEDLQQRPAPGLAPEVTASLCDVIESARATLAEPVDEAGRLFLTYLYPACARHEPSQAMPALPSGALLYWGHQSAHQEILVGRVHTACPRLAWPQLCASGVFAWARDRATLVPLMEQAARVAYTAGDDVDPVQCTLFYLAMRRENTVRSLWRRAIGHPDQGKMTRFLANDFSIERWRVAAQKNAFALISQRRFDFAAAFFLLGDALQDAVNVCVRNMHNIPLAIAIARVYEEEDCGPVFERLLRNTIVPLAVTSGERWLGCWALSVLGDYGAVLRMLHDLDADFDEGVGNDIQDPALVLALEQAKTQSWFATNESELPPASESALVRFAAERWQAMGCDYIGLGTLAAWSFARDIAPAAPPPEQPTKKIASLLAPERAPPSSQGAAEFDLGAFGF